MEFQISYHLQRGPIFLLSCMYELMLFWFYVRVFQIMGSRCSRYDIVKNLMEFLHSNNLQLSPVSLGGTNQLLLFW